MFVVERVYEGFKKEDKLTMVAETKGLLVDELNDRDWETS